MCYILYISYNYFQSPRLAGLFDPISSDLEEKAENKTVSAMSGSFITVKHVLSTPWGTYETAFESILYTYKVSKNTSFSVLLIIFYI